MALKKIKKVVETALNLNPQTFLPKLSVPQRVGNNKNSVSINPTGSQTIPEPKQEVKKDNIPLEKPKTNYTIDRSKEGVTYKVGDQEIKLTPEENRAYTSGVGKMTPNVENLKNVLARTREATANVNADIEGAQKKNDIEQFYLNSGLAPNAETIPTNVNQLQQPQNFSSPLDKILPTQAEAPNVIGAITPTLLKGTAQLLDNVNNFLPSFLRLSMKEPKQVSEAKEAFTLSSSTTDNLIEGVRMGSVGAGVVISDIQEQIKKVNVIEAQLHGQGRINPNFWLNEGADQEALVKDLKDKLNQQLAELQVAQQEGRINQARQRAAQMYV